MFALRGIAVSLACFVLLYGLLSALVVVVWRALKMFRLAQQNLTALLCGLRVFPFVASVVVTFAFVVPSFQLLEPRTTDEGVGALPSLLGFCALVLIVCGCFRVIAAHIKTSRVVADWLEGAPPLDTGANIDTRALTFRSGRETPPLTLVGVLKARVLVSESSLAVLSHDELRIVLKHELAHVRSHDNLKKLAFRFCPFPGMTGLEIAWAQSAELAADDAAVSKASDAVDLAAALIKLSRLIPVEVAPVCTAGLVTGSVNERVTRLLAWNETSKAHAVRIRPSYAIPPLLVTMVCIFATYGPMLARTHEVTEWLVR